MNRANVLQPRDLLPEGDSFAWMMLGSRIRNSRDPLQIKAHLSERFAITCVYRFLPLSSSERCFSETSWKFLWQQFVNRFDNNAAAAKKPRSGIYQSWCSTIFDAYPIEKVVFFGLRSCETPKQKLTCTRKLRHFTFRVRFDYATRSISRTRVYRRSCGRMRKAMHKFALTKSKVRCSFQIARRLIATIKIANLLSRLFMNLAAYHINDHRSNLTQIYLVSCIFL